MFATPKKYEGIPPGWEAYRNRDRILEEMGYGSYRDYLNSELWLRVKMKFLPRFAPCAIPGCLRNASTLHHADYTRAALEGRRDEMMFPICHSCHVDIEKDDEGRKLPPPTVALLTGMFRTCSVCERVKPIRGWSKTSSLCPSCLGRRAALEGQRKMRILGSG